MITSCSTMITTSSQRSPPFMEPPLFSEAEWHACLDWRRKKHTETTRLLCKDPNLRAMIGERASARPFGAPPDLRIFEHGDGGVDFKAELRSSTRGMPWFFTIDAKASPWGDCLRIEPRKVDRTVIYILVYVPRAVTDTSWDAGEVIGWEHGNVLADIEPENRFGTGKLHIKDVPLRPIEELIRAYTGRWCHHGCPIQHAW